ncbi:MAG: pirin family protein [Weeksellaceae bacterium]|nr:pirin family protein [Weeksellaceae bacterium]
MKTEIYKSHLRGGADHGWLQTFHSFSFANFFDPERMGFGALRVLNDDSVAGGKGFGSHPHADMEIITYPLSGALQHADSLGNKATIKAGEVQIMSAGTGMVHSEMNADPSEPVKFLQIWITPHTKKVQPRYDQISLEQIEHKDGLQLLIAPKSENAPSWLHQDAWLYRGLLYAGQKIDYTLQNAENGVYIFVTSGALEIDEHPLGSRDAIAISQTKKFEIQSLSHSEFLIIEVPLS